MFAVLHDTRRSQNRNHRSDLLSFRRWISWRTLARLLFALPFLLAVGASNFAVAVPRPQDEAILEPLETTDAPETTQESDDFDLGDQGTTDTTTLQPPGDSAVPMQDSKPESTAQPEVQQKTQQKTQPKVPQPFDGDAAWQHLVTVCQIGPRISTSDGMRQQQRYLKKHFESTGGTVVSQQFQAVSPFNNKTVALHNMIVQYHPERRQRLLLCCHYDTRPFADRDQRNPRAKFLGANDGGSGVAVLCEIGEHLKDLDGLYGVDLVFFDGEEFIIDSRVHPMFLGSTFFSQQYASGQLPWRYDYGILLDMVGDKDLQIYFEANSLTAGPDRLTRSIWSVAQGLGVREFIPQKRHIIKDDHLPLNNIARIPTCDIIDFDYPNPRAGNVYWHTTNDNLRNCSRESLHKVGTVVLAWLRQMQAMNAPADSTGATGSKSK